MNIREGRKRFEIVLYGLWSISAFAFGITDFLGDTYITTKDLLLFGLAWVAPIVCIAITLRVVSWVLEGFFQKRDPN